jgi:hypothetical protein
MSDETIMSKIQRRFNEYKMLPIFRLWNTHDKLLASVLPAALPRTEAPKAHILVIFFGLSSSAAKNKSIFYNLL